jgi:hypothetical protein
VRQGCNASFREEHRQALAFLNDLGGEKARFFGLEIGAARIGASLPAPLFRVVAQPNDFHAQAAAAARVSSEPPTGRGAHRADCGSGNHGTGVHRGGQTANGRWLDPFQSRQEARNAVSSEPSVRDCTKCKA